jgi:hypothetical protein
METQEECQKIQKSSKLSKNSPWPWTRSYFSITSEQEAEAAAG